MQAAAGAARRGACAATAALRAGARRFASDAPPPDAADAKAAFMAKAGKSLAAHSDKFVSLEEALASKRLALKKAGLPVKEVRPRGSSDGHFGQSAHLAAWAVACAAWRAPFLT
jgi:hypothetical protein